MGIDILYEVFREEKTLQESKFKHSDTYYIQALLQEKFKQKFSLDEVEALLDEVLPEWQDIRLEHKGHYLVPHWYQAKWFRGKQKLAKPLPPYKTVKKIKVIPYEEVTRRLLARGKKD